MPDCSRQPLGGAVRPHAGVSALRTAAEQLTNSPEQAVYVGRAGLEPATNGL